MLIDALCAGGFDHTTATRLVDHDSTQPDIKRALVDATQRAHAAGAFGAPTMLVTRARDGRTEMFFGADRFDHIAAFLETAYINPTADPFVSRRTSRL